MAHFSEYQVRRFRFIFNQYSEDAVSQAYIETGSGGGAADTGDDDGPRNWTIKLTYRLTAHELHHLLPRLGPPVSLEQTRLILYKYDTSCTGAIDFEDFLEFLADYQATLAQKRENALNHYSTQQELAESPEGPDQPRWAPGDPIASRDAKVVVARHFIAQYPDQNSYLESQLLDDPEFYFTKQETITNDIIAKGYVDDMNALRRRIVFRICAARNLAAYTRLKKRPKTGVDFFSMDAFVRVKCAGITLDTTAVLGSTKPEWDQDLIFNITIPPGEIHDIQQWVDRQVFEVSLMDHNDTGVVTHAEHIATAYIPLLRVLLSAKKPIWQVLKLNSTDNVTADDELPCVEVSIVDQTQERWAWAKVIDGYTYPEEFWLKKYPDKLTDDILPPKNNGIKKKVGVSRRGTMNFKDIDNEVEIEFYRAGIDIWTQYNVVTRPLRAPFRRRTFNAFALDEDNNLRPLTSLVRPITIHDERLVTPQQVFAAVCRIPYHTPVLPRSEISQKMTANLLSIKEEERLEADDPPDSADIAGWKIRQFPQSLAVENFYAQVKSPQTTLLSKRGSLMEHAILLCGLFLGMGLKSYVAIGKIKRRPYVWVVTINPISTRDDDETFDEFAPCKISYYFDDNSPTATFDRTEFANLESAIFAQEMNKKVKIVHWDALTGTCYDNPKKKGFIFDRLETLFNHENIYYNVQKSDLLNRPFFSWHLENLDCWIPFFPEPLTANDPIKCFYSTPTYVMYSASLIDTFTTNDDDKYLVKDLVEHISLYRRHLLFIPQTDYFPDASKYLQTQLNRFEVALGAKMSQRSAVNIGDNPFTVFDQRLSPMEAAPLRSGESRSSLVSNQIFKDNSLADITTENLVVTINEAMTELVPDGHWWRGSVFHFKDTELESIMDQLVTSGILDASIPNVMYVVSARIFKHPLGTVSVWIGIGYVADLAAMELMRQ